METNNVNLKNWKSLIRPSKIDIDQNDDKTFAKVVAEPLEKGYGLTIGNSLRKYCYHPLEELQLQLFK